MTVTFFLQVQDNFDRMDFNKMCWTLCARKNLNRNHLLISDDDAFKIWCIFNFLSEEKYPLVMVTEEVGGILSPSHAYICDKLGQDFSLCVLVLAID